MVACRYGISLLVFNLTSHSSMIIPTRAHDYSLFIWEFGGFWGTAPFYGKYFEFHMTLAMKWMREIFFVVFKLSPALHRAEYFFVWPSYLLEIIQERNNLKMFFLFEVQKNYSFYLPSHSLTSRLINDEF